MGMRSRYGFKREQMPDAWGFLLMSVRLRQSEMEAFRQLADRLHTTRAQLARGVLLEYIAECASAERVASR